ncbi:MAG: hypothetical protein H0U54_11940 [Acidobacteria bacterium]|nr:hypothetical protein [Acidobacteriota bacterium]
MNSQPSKSFRVSIYVAMLISASLFACMVVFVTAPSSKASASVVQATTVQVDPATYQKKTIYSSYPQKCGDGTNNCRSSEWTGAWFMPDGSLMVAFNQATGPTSPAQGRTFTPEKLLNEFKLDDGRIWTHAYPAPKGYWHWDKGYDYYGLSGDCPSSSKLPTTQRCSLIVYLKSTDAGQTWATWRTETFHAIGMSAFSPQPTIALSNGTLIRRVNGDDMRNVKKIPYTAMLQVLKPKGGVYPARWPALGAAGQVVIKDPSVCKYQVSRIRQLKDGRYIALGQSWRYAGGGTSGACASLDGATNMLLVAASAAAAEQGQWKRGMPEISASILVANEWDAAQLANGDLLALFRTKGSATSRTQIRKQAILKVRPASECPDKTASGCWVLDETTLGNPGNLPHSGHPELLATREGVIIQFATSGNSYTNDNGASWIPLTGTTPSNYYPRSIQNSATGDIFLFGHVGGDDPYGGKSIEGGGNYSGINQTITMQRFRLIVNQPPSGSAP